MRATVLALERRVREEAARYRGLLHAYEEVIAIGRAEQSVAALARQGALYEALVRTILEEPDHGAGVGAQSPICLAMITFMISFVPA